MIRTNRLIGLFLLVAGTVLLLWQGWLFAQTRLYSHLSYAFVSLLISFLGAYILLKYKRQ